MPNSFVNFVKNVERIGQKKRGRHPVFNAHQFYPSAIEADLQKATREEFLRALEENIKLALIGFNDGIDELAESTPSLPPEFTKKVSSLADAVGVKTGWNFSEYSKMTIGQPYFPPPAEAQIFDVWKKNFQQLCISAESDAKAQISRLAAEGKMKGWNKRQLEAAIREKLPDETKHRAELIARTEIGKLNSASNLSTYKQLGIQYYKWLTTLDGRERDSHSHMNNKICSVDDPSVYYEETPDGLVEHPRTGSMYHGNPGEDFQCRCSMVAWDPEIDGLYEVKKETPVEPPQQNAEAATAQKLEKMEQSIAEQEKQLQQLRSEQEALLQKKRLEEAAEKRHNRTPEQIADIQRRWDERKAKRTIMARAEKRHAERKPEQIAAIRNELERRLAIRKKAHEALQAAEGVKGIKDIPELEKALQKGGKSAYKEMESLSGELESKMSKLKGCTYLADPIQAAKDFDFDTAIVINESVKKKIEGMSKILSSRKDSLEFEIKWVEDHKKYASWKVAQDAYKKALAEVDKKLEWEADVTRAEGIKEFLKKHPKSGIIKTLSEEVDALMAIGDDAAHVKAKELLAKAEKRRSEIENKERTEAARKLKERLAKLGPAKSVGGASTLEELKTVLGDSLPKTLEHLDDAIAKYEKSHRYGREAKAHAAEIEETMRNLFATHDLGMHIDDYNLEKVLNSHFKNTFETGSSGGYSGPALDPDGKINLRHSRLGAAHNLFGLGSIEKSNQLEIFEYEKYGNLLDHDKLREVTGYNRASQYGNVAVRFKKDKVICTWTAGDSLGESYQPSLVTDPKAVSYDDMSLRRLPTKGTKVENMMDFRDHNINSYLELQYHGSVTVDCVESLTFPYDLTDKAKASMLEVAKKWQKTGAEVYYVKNGKLEKL